MYDAMAPSVEKRITDCVDDLEKRAMAINEYIDQLRTRTTRVSKRVETAALAKERKPIASASELQNQIRTIDGLLEDGIDKLRYILDNLDL